MKIRLLLIIVSSLAMATDCAWSPPADPSDSTKSIPRIVLQITENQDRSAFDKVVAELQARGAKASILVTADFVRDNCQVLAELHAQGYEVMAFLRPVSATGQKLTLSSLSRQEQEAVISETKTVLENCLGAPVTGFRATNFNQNQDTWQIVSALGFQYNLAFVAGQSYLPGHEADTLPYASTSYGFWAVPMHVADRDGRLTAFCDNPFESLPAAEWEALLKSEFDRMRQEDRPLLVEFHPYLSGVDEGRFQAFVSLLDYAVQEGAEFLTTAQYLAWSQQQLCEE
jgi:peptidoglycan/xylan/chitin deacetylase (PgdA/CDA1 family)